MFIRPAAPQDYAAVSALEEAVYRLHYDRRKDAFRLRSQPLPYDRYLSMLNDMVFLVAEEDGVLLGQVIAFKRCYKDHPVFNDLEWLEIDDISVLPEAQGKGMGRALFEAVRQRALEMGLHHMELCVWAFNENARRFYEKMGMRSRIDRMEMDI